MLASAVYANGSGPAVAILLAAACSRETTYLPDGEIASPAVFSEAAPSGNPITVIMSSKPAVTCAIASRGPETTNQMRFSERGQRDVCAGAADDHASEGLHRVPRELEALDRERDRDDEDQVDHALVIAYPTANQNPRQQPEDVAQGRASRPQIWRHIAAKSGTRGRRRSRTAEEGRYMIDPPLVVATPLLRRWGM